MSSLGVGVIGLGVGEQHAHAFADHAQCAVTALCDRIPARLAALAASFPNATPYADANDLIDDPSVSIVTVASNDDDHHAQIIRALRAGKHVFAEKPLCLRREELDEIRDVWRATGGLRLSTNTVLRRSPRFQWLREAIVAGRLGRVFSIEADYVYGRLSKLTHGWRGQIPNYSVVLGGAIHLVDLVLWMSRERPIEVMAVASDAGSRGSGFAGNDLVIALLRFESGLVARVGANFASVHPHFHRLLVYGTEATFENTPGDRAHLWTSRDAAADPELVATAYPGVRKGDLVPAFVDAVLGRGEPDVTEDEVFAAVSVCLAIDESARDRRLVRVDYC